MAFEKYNVGESSAFYGVCFTMGDIMTSSNKTRMYSAAISKFKKGLKEGFYFECILLDYSLLEDCFTDFFVQLDFASKDNEDTGKAKFNRFRKSDLMSLGMEEKECSLHAFAKKVKIVKTIIESINKPEKISSVNMQAVANVLKRNHISKLLTNSFFEEADQWRENRNKIIHDLLNLDCDIFNSLKLFAEKGFELFRVLDKCNSKIKGKVKPEINKLKKKQRQ